MNFLDASVDHVDDETVVLDGPDGFDLRVEAAALPADALEYDEVVAGIRPEDLVVREDGFPTEVRVVEAMGDEKVVYADCGGIELIARLNSRLDVDVGDAVRFGLSVEDLYLFDPETEAAVKTKADSEPGANTARREFVDAETE